jgi:hypothetical protein
MSAAVVTCAAGLSTAGPIDHFAAGSPEVSPTWTEG